MRPSTCTALAVIVTVLSGVAGAGAAQAPPSIAYTTKKVERWDSTCPAHGAWTCPHITFTYLVIERAAHAAVATAINQEVADFLLTSIGEPRKSASIDAAMTTFLEGYQEYRRIGGTDRAYWDERTVTIVYQSQRIISLNFVYSFATGGLHPQYASLFTCFNAETGARIRLADVLVPGYEPELTRIAERKFRAMKGIGPGQSLDEAGYGFFPNHTFALTTNVWIGPAGLTFFYNLYEIAGYAQGTTELLLPYGEIRDLLAPDGPLGPMR